MTVWCGGMPLPDARLVPPARRRIWELDFLRGVFILLMVMDHTFFDIGYEPLFGNAWLYSRVYGAHNMVLFCQWYWYHPAREIIHDLVLWGFFLLSGISVVLSRNNYLHAVKIGLCAALLSVGSLLAEQWGLDSGIAVRWGVLQTLAVGCLLSAVVYGAVRRNRYCQMAVFGGLALFFYLVETLYISPRTWPSTPDWLCIFADNMGDAYSFTPGDSFPLLGSTPFSFSVSAWWRVPYLSRVMVGGMVAAWLYPAKRTLLPRLDRAWCRPVCFVGRHTLWVVVSHQIVIPLVLAVVSGWFITPGNYVIF